MNMMSIERGGFRSDINGLRAWAVVAVVLYHFGIPGFSGGFIGVDVFFVISGFLMTGIVVSGLEKGNFSILSFYMARCRRILPALLVLCTVLLILGWWLMPAADYKALSALSASSVTFLSNIKFWLEAGYFDNASHEKWLLHTWSLAVEWQFYLILPLVLSIIWRVRPGRNVASLAVIICLLASFVMCVALTPTKPTGSFFMLPTRAWEMLAGGVVYLYSAGLKRSAWRERVLELIGLASIVISIGIFEASSAWPGWRAGLPVVGTMLVLFAARDKSAMTGNILVQWLGTRSYSLYLWHWPIAVALRYLDVFTQPVAVLLGLVVTCLLGDASYRLVETGSGEYLRKLPQVRGFVTMLGCAAVVAGLSGVVYLNNGFTGRLGQNIEIVSQEQFNGNDRRANCMLADGIESPSCTYGGKKLRVILLGDSHADAVVTSLASSLPQPYGVMEWSYGACPILLGAHRVNFQLRSKCGDFVDRIMQKLHSVPRDVPVVIVNRHGQYALGQNEDVSQKNMPLVYFSTPFAKSEPSFLDEYAKHITDVACEIAKERQVYLVRPIPEMGYNVPNTARKMILGNYKYNSISVDDYHARNDFAWKGQNVAREQCGVVILDPLPYLCPNGVCHSLKNGRPIYFDDNHLSEFGNKLLVPMFEKIILKDSTHHQ